MLPIHQNLEAKDFEYSENVQAMQYCTESGDLATENCPSTATGWYKETYIPSTCILHRGGSTADTELEDENDENEDSSSSNHSNGSGNSKRPSLNRNDQPNKQDDDDDEDSFWNSVSGLFGSKRQ